MTLPHAVILAGGRGERLGGIRKAELRFGGKRCLDRIAAALGPVDTPLMVAVGPEATALSLPAGAEAVADLTPTQGGPLAGLAAAIQALQARGIEQGLLVSAAVDTPLLPDDFASAMSAALGDAAAGFAAWGEDFYPTNAIWRIEALADLPSMWLSGKGPTSPRALLANLDGRRIDWRDRCTGNPFRNVNTLADLLHLQRMLAKQSPVLREK